MAAGFALVTVPLDSFPLGVWYEGGVGAVRHNLIPDDPELAHDLYLRSFRDIAAHGCNVAVAPNSPPEHHMAILDAAEKAGIKLILELGFEGGPIGGAIRKGGSPDPDNLQTAFRERLKPIQGHPALLRVQLLDEPWKEVMSTYGLVAEAMRAYSPKVPAFCCIIEADNAGHFLECSKSDVVAFDCYPLSVKTPIGDENALSRFEDVALKAASEARKHKADAWAVIQCHSITNGLRHPTVGELRRMTYGAIAAGCRGIFWFLYQTEWLDPKEKISMDGLVDQKYQERPLWKEIKKLTAQIKKWAPILQKVVPMGPVELKSGRAKTMKLASDYGSYLFVWSTDVEEETFVEVEFRKCRELRVVDVASGREARLDSKGEMRRLRTRLQAGGAVLYHLGPPMHKLDDLGTCEAELE